MPGCLDENTIVAFADGRFAADEIARVDAHVVGCADCRRLVAAALELRTQDRAATATMGRAALGGALPRGTTIGRYTILGLAGRGGMGEVYAAYDIELDRKVALKVLNEGSRDQARGQARLLLEARAMAKLSHSNVVAVHEVGTFGARVFVAMEFVDGVTLSEWLAERPRVREEVLAVFIKAARGLAAAHAAGLVHRDFKPGNVMVTRDGDVRVLDFGLARHLGDADQPPHLARPTGGLAPGVQVTAAFTLTATGELLGTPRYMAPEQMRAAATDARTNQFSFCVALYEALYGEPPFAGASAHDLVPEVLAGRVRPATPKSNVPAWLRRALLRGLAVNPDARWSSMEALVAALARDPAQTRRRWTLAAGALALVALSAAALVRNVTRPVTLCRGALSRLAGVWEPGDPTGQRHEGARRAFLASGSPGATEVWERVAPLLDRYAADWLAVYGEACEGTHLRHEQSAAILDLRMTCLDERRTALGALTDLFVKADRGVVAKAVDATMALPPIERCSNVEQLRKPIEPPRDPATRERVDRLRKRLAVAKALTDTGNNDEAGRRTRAAIDEARVIGYSPLVAEALMALARNFSGGTFSREALPPTEEAIWIALAASEDELATEAAVVLTCELSAYLAQPQRGTFWAALSQALLARVGPGHDLIRAWLLQGEAVSDLQEKAPGPALEAIRRAVALKERVLPSNHPEIARALNTEAEALFALGRPAEALSVSDRGYAIFLAAYGTASAEVATLLSNKAEYLLALGRPHDALEPSRRSLAAWEAQVGDDHPFLAYPLTALGRAYLNLGRPEAAEPPLERALRLRQAREPDAALVAETRNALARARGALASHGAPPTGRRTRTETGP